MNAKISVIIPVYNVENYIKRCIDSAVNQSFRDIEILIIDDFGDDNSIKIANEYAIKDPRIRIIKSDKGKDVSEARNTGIRHSKGEYIYFLDADDYMEKSLLEKTYIIAANNCADMISFGAQMVYDDCEPEIFISNSAYPKNNLEALELLSNFKIGYMPWDKLTKASVIKNNNIKFVSMPKHEDIFFAIQSVYYSRKIIAIPDVLYNYYQRTNSRSSDRYIDKSLFKTHFESYFEVINQVDCFIHETPDLKDNVKTAMEIEKGILIWFIERLREYYCYGFDELDEDLLLSFLHEKYDKNCYFIYSMLDMILKGQGVTKGVANNRNILIKILKKIKGVVI